MGSSSEMWARMVHLPRGRRWRRLYHRMGLWCLAALVASSLWGTVVWPRRYVLPQLFGEAVFWVRPSQPNSQPRVALTFDDGPDPRYSAFIAQILADRQAVGTFFMVGQAMAQHPATARTVIRLGHEVGNHSWSHRSLNYQTPASIRQELESTDRMIQDLGYAGPLHFRPPFGHNLLFLPWVLNHMQRPIAFWNIQLQDWDAPPPAVMLAQLDAHIHDGAIVLLHDGDANPRSDGRHSRDNTVALVELILDTYIPQGYRFVGLSELVRAGTPQRWPGYPRRAAAP